MTLLNRDFKSAAPGEANKAFRRHHLHALIVAAALASGAIALFSPTDRAEATRQLSEEEVGLSLESLPLSLHESATETASQESAIPQVAEEPALNWQPVEVAAGDSMARIFDRLGLDPKTLHQMVVVDKQNHNGLGSIFPGQTLEFAIEEGTLLGLRYPVDKLTTVTLQRNGDDEFGVTTESKSYDIRRRQVAGKIDSTLFQAGYDVGLSDKTLMELVAIFGWDIDFALDIRADDRFSLIYEERYLDGERQENGAILAAEFVNEGRTYRAIRYTDSNDHTDYYSPDGKSMRKAFLRSPVDFRRISSRFTRERYHPVLGKKRPHRGVDYAAATGTPIKAAGDGKVIFRGKKGGYGNVVILQHGGNITTLYGHMSKFRRGVVNGSRVKQGQIIGYVGMTGVATGPHLHYEFRVDGVHRNPLTVKLPSAEPIKQAERAEFDKTVAQLSTQLDQVSQTQLALVAQ